VNEDRLLTIEFTGSDLPLVRVTLAAALDRAGMPEPRRSAFVQAALEAVSNAVVHGGGEGRLTALAANGEVRCEVTDRGPGPAAVALPSGTSAGGGGRGLLLAQALGGPIAVGPGPGGQGTTVALTASPADSAALAH
jgi:anti-sigma regulatory factor (Ser/Thr protein kinase)